MSNFTVTEDVDTQNIVTYIVDWTIIFQIGAEALAEALGAQLGENLGNNFTNALFGKNKDDEYQKEVIARLIRIEEKLDRILKFVESQLQQLLAKEIRIGFINDHSIIMRSSIEMSNSYINMYDNKTLLNVDILHSSLEDVVKSILNLAKYGWETFTALIEGYTVIVSGYSRLINYDKRYAHFLGEHSQKLNNHINNMLDPNILGSVTKIENDLQALLDDANKKISQIPSSDFLLTCMPLQILPDQPISIYQSIGYSGYLKHNGEKWEGNWSNTPIYKTTTNSSQDIPPMYGLPIIDWAYPIPQVTTKTKRWNIWHNIQSIANSATENQIIQPQRLIFLREAKTCLQHLQRSSTEFSKLSGLK